MRGLMLEDLIDAIADRVAEKLQAVGLVGASAPASDDRLLTREEICDALQISPPTLMRHVNAGMPCVRLGSLTRYRLADVIAWCQDRDRARRDDYGPVLKSIPGVTLKTRRRRAANG